MKKYVSPEWEWKLFSKDILMTSEEEPDAEIDPDELFDDE